MIPLVMSTGAQNENESFKHMISPEKRNSANTDAIWFYIQIMLGRYRFLYTRKGKKSVILTMWDLQVMMASEELAARRHQSQYKRQKININPH